MSELFVERTKTALAELMGRPLADVRLAVMMLDGIDIADRTHVVALGITTDGVKIPLGLWEGSTENATLARSLLSDLVDRGLDPEQAILFVIDGGKALRRAIKDVFGEQALVHRCHRHKERNVTDLLPERDRPMILAKIRGAWSLTDADLAQERLERLASELDRTWPDAAGSLREGLAETLTLMRLGIGGQLAKTLCSTNPCESMIEIVRYTQRNVKRWQDGDMRKRWTAAGMLVAEQQFRRIIGYRDLATLVIAIERHAARPPSAPRPLSPTLRCQKPLLSDCHSPGGRRQSSTTIRTSSAGVEDPFMRTACVPVRSADRAVATGPGSLPRDHRVRGRRVASWQRVLVGPDRLVIPRASGEGPREAGLVRTGRSRRRHRAHSPERESPVNDSAARRPSEAAGWRCGRSGCGRSRRSCRRTSAGRCCA